MLNTAVASLTDGFRNRVIMPMSVYSFAIGIVIVSGSQMDITADAVFLLAHHKRDFAVGFQDYQAVNCDTPPFQLSRPYDIVFLVKTRLQLHKHGNLLSVFRRLGQRHDNGRIAADAVQCLLDGQHLRIPGGFPDELHHRGKGLEGMVQQNVSCLILSKQIPLP